MSMAKFRKVKNNRKNSPTRGMIYGRAVVNRVVHTSAIAKKITERCTVTEPDILAVINALMTEISANIADGNKVVLDEARHKNFPSRKRQEVHLSQHQGYVHHLLTLLCHGPGQASKADAQWHQDGGDDRVQRHRRQGK